MSRTRFFFFGGGSTVPGFGGGGAGFAGAGAGTGVDGTSMTVESAFDGGASCAPMAAKLLKLDRRLSARAARTARTRPSTKDSKNAENAKRSTTTNFDGPHRRRQRRLGELGGRLAGERFRRRRARRGLDARRERFARAAGERRGR